MIEDWLHWMYQYPSTAVTETYKGDTTVAKRYGGDANKLLYELKNGMKFNRLGMNKMTRIFTDGTVITAKSHFGYDMVEIDVTGTTLAEVLPCTITLIDLPDAIPPMKYAGEVHAGEVEGIDYIKTYYIADKTNCSKCDDNPDSTVCTTAELAVDETKCTPFTFEDATVESKEGEPNNHCLEPSEHCQAEVISFGQDGSGTYFTWKAYTEWPPDEASGYGFMQMKGFFKLEGKLDNECETTPVVIEVNCCEKNDSAYKAVHTSDWGDLDIEYTLLTMGCDESQTLTAKYGCPPFVWTLVSGGGALTPAEDGLTAIYESPETNPSCVSNPTIKLEDRCENSKELKLAINCYTGIAGSFFTWNIIGQCKVFWGYVEYPIPDYFDVYLWDIYSSILYCNGDIDPPVFEQSFYSLESTPPTSPTIYICTESSGYIGICQTVLSGGATRDAEGLLQLDCPIDGGLYRTFCKQLFVDQYQGFHDLRTEEMKEAGCCPINPETGSPL